MKAAQQSGLGQGLQDPECKGCGADAAAGQTNAAPDDLLLRGFIGGNDVVLFGLDDLFGARLHSLVAIEGRFRFGFGKTPTNEIQQRNLADHAFFAKRTNTKTFSRGGQRPPPLGGAHWPLIPTARKAFEIVDPQETRACRNLVPETDTGRLSP